jgi:hypothetical protein
VTLVALGPLRYEVVGPLPPFLRARALPGSDGAARVVEVVVTAALPADATPVHNTAVRAGDDGDTVYLRADQDPLRSLHGPFAQLVARDLAGLDALLLHASAVRVTGGVALLVGPPSVGKSTFAGHDPARAFAGNAVCARRDGARWVAAALPFASDPDPRLDATGEAPVAAIVELSRASAPSFEWGSAARATMLLTRCCVAPSLGDPWRRRRAVAMLDLGASVGIASLGAAGTRADLDLLDRCLNERARG